MPFKIPNSYQSGSVNQGLTVVGLQGSTVTLGSTQQYQQTAQMLSSSDQFLTGTNNIWTQAGLPDPSRAIWSAGVSDSSGYGLRVARPVDPTVTAVQSNSGGGNDNAGGGAGISMGIGIGGTVVAGLINALGSASAAKYLAEGQNAMLEAQAHVAENNAKLFENQASIAKAAAEWKFRKVSAQYGEEKAKMKAGMAANGVAIGAGGTSAEMLASNDIYKAIDKRQAAINAVAEAWGFKARASSARNEAWAARAGKGSPSQIGLSSGAVAFQNTMKPLYERGLSLSLNFGGK